MKKLAESVEISHIQISRISKDISNALIEAYNKQFEEIDDPAETSTKDDASCSKIGKTSTTRKLSEEKMLKRALKHFVKKRIDVLEIPERK